MSTKIVPFGDNVVVEIVDQDKTKGGLYIPDKAKTNQRDAIIGKVLAAGTGRISENGALMPAYAKEGEYVLLARGAGVEVELSPEDRGKDKRRVRILRGVELLGAVEESTIILLGLAELP